MVGEGIDKMQAELRLEKESIENGDLLDFTDMAQLCQESVVEDNEKSDI